MNISIGKYVYNAIQGVSESLHVYPVIATFNDPQPPTPFAVYQRTSAEPDYTKSLFTGLIRHNYSVTVVDDNYSNTVTLAQQVVDALLALSHTRHEDISFGQVIMTDLTEDFLDGLFLQTIQFEINTKEIKSW